MVDFVRLAATAQRLIEQNGRDATLLRFSRTPDDAGKPWRGSSSATPEATLGPVKMAFVPASGSGFGRVLEAIPGEIAKRISEVALLAADSVAALTPPPADLDPKRYDTVSDDGKAWEIIEVGELKPADKLLIWVIGVST